MSLALWRKSQMNLSMKQIQAHIENRQVAAKERGRDGAEDWLLPGGAPSLWGCKELDTTEHTQASNLIDIEIPYHICGNTFP